jgi:uncharacterized protein YndB with AHSA1/START domain
MHQKIWSLMPFASAEAMAQWWGPADFPITVLSFDFKGGGVFHYKMDLPTRFGTENLSITRSCGPICWNSLLLFLMLMEKSTRAPFAAEWPLEIFNRFVFSENNGKTYDQDDGLSCQSK